MVLAQGIGQLGGIFNRRWHFLLVQKVALEIDGDATGANDTGSDDLTP